MGQIIRKCTFTSDDSVNIQDIRGNISRWINDSSNFGFGFGHFSTPVKNKYIGPGCSIQISGQWYIILSIKNDGDNLGEVQLNKNPPLGRVNKIQGLRVKNNAISVPQYNSQYSSNDHLLIEEIGGNGKDGDLVVSNTMSINAYSTIVGTVPFTCGTTQIAVSSVSGFSINDEIFLIQMQHSDPTKVGQYQTNYIKSISNKTITLKYPISISLDSSNTEGFPYRSIAQLIKIPQYNSVKILTNGKLTCAPWNGYTGGILIFRSKETISIDGTIDVSYCGFRGAPDPRVVVQPYSSAYNCDGGRCGGYRGEGCFGRYGPSYVDSGGGSFPPNYFPGGQNAGYVCGVSGGAGFGGAGTAGVYFLNRPQGHDDLPGTPGSSIFDSSLNQLTLGAGGSSCGHSWGHSWSCGGPGGGACIILGTSLVISNSGSIKSNGAEYGINGMTSGGCGSGGPIIIYSSKLIQNAGQIQAKGGSGRLFYYHPFDPDPNSADGAIQSGNGGGGRVVRYTPNYIGNLPNVGNGTSISSQNSMQYMKFGLLPSDVIWLGTGYLFQTPQYDILDFSKIDKILFTYNSPCDKDIIRVGIKFDNNSYITWNGSSWIDILYDDILTSGMTLSTLHSLTSYNFLLPNSFIRGMKKIQLAASITSYNKFEPASISEIDIYGTLRSWRLWNIQVPRKIMTVTPNQFGKLMNQS